MRRRSWRKSVRLVTAIRARRVIYMPMVGHIAENSLAIDHEFREGNAAPAAGNLEFVQACERKMPRGKRIKAVRADSAAYQADVFNYCEETHRSLRSGRIRTRQSRP